MTVVAHVGGRRDWWHRGFILGGAPVLQIVRWLWTGFFGRNPCRLARHRRGAAYGWHLPFLKGAVATRRPLPSVYWGKS